MVCNMYKGGKWCRYVKECVLIEIKKEFVSSILYISGSFSICMVFIFNDIETFYCPNKITGKIFTVHLNNSTNE